MDDNEALPQPARTKEQVSQRLPRLIISASSNAADTGYRAWLPLQCPCFLKRWIAENGPGPEGYAPTSTKSGAPSCVAWPAYRNAASGATRLVWHSWAATRRRSDCEHAL